MAKPDQVVILGSTLTALALLRAAHDMNAASTIVDTSQGIAWDSRFPDKRLLPNDDLRIVDDLLDLARQRRSVLIADSDHWLRFIARHRAVLAPAFADILHPDNDCIETCLDKSRFLGWCEREQLSAPQVYTLSGKALTPPARFPVLIRPRETRHNISDEIPKAVTVHSTGELDAWLSRFDRAGVEPDVCESLLSPTVMAFSVGAVRNRGGELVTVVAQKVRTPPSYCSGGTFVELKPQATVEALARTALERLNYYGIAEVEIMFEPETGLAYLIELNVRPWVQYALAERTGHRFLSFLLDDARQYRSPRAGQPHERLKTGAWISFTDDLLVCFSKEKGLVRNGHLSIADYLRSLWKASAYAFWSASDPQPFLSSTARFLRRTFRSSHSA